MNRPEPTKIALLALAAALSASAAQACPGVGVILRIEGKPQDVIIMRSDNGAPRAPVPRPRVLEVLCEGDTIRVQNGAAVTLSLDGQPTAKVQGAEAYTVGARKGAPTLAGNAYRNVSEHLLPDMKRQPWDVRLRGPGRELGFALPTLSAGRQTLSAAQHTLLVRLDGGVGAYKVQLVSDAGAVVAQGAGSSTDIVLSNLNLSPGGYVIKAADSSGANIEAKITVVADRPPLSQDYSGLADAEVQAAATAADLAREHPEVWSLEAEQLLQQAPASGLDRESVFELIETYGA